MPGTLPMKVIKVGTSSQSRIAQACDRCRSKKVKCDGIRPCCTQCANVGFECRTSDKLSRRAFPRGYTESLEERVRQLELEVRDLKDLLDEKEEKLDMLSKVQSHHRRTSTASRPNPASPLASVPSVALSVTSSSPATATCGSDTHASPSSSPPRGAVPQIRTAAATAGYRDADTAVSLATPLVKEDTFRVQASPLVLGVEHSDSYFMGASSGRSFIDIFKRRMQESGKPCLGFHAEAFLHIQGCYPLVEKRSATATRVPPRLFSDRCVNVYFQEWSPLFPIIHRPSFLHIYDEFSSDTEKVKNLHKLAQLYLVFSIAGLSGDQPDLEQIAVCEQEWQRALDAVLMDSTMVTLQCLVLAVLYCTMRADYKRLLYYKGIAVGLSHRLGLHQSQKRFSFGALTIETRKKVFWSLYTLDCFSAAVLGLPKQLKDDDIQTEYPADADDEYVTEEGFQPTLPGESTRLSSALALFRLSRVLARVLDENYPAAAAHELSLQRMASLESDLVKWRDALPWHLSVAFREETPSTNVTSNRSPLLALAFYYARTLIWRPAIGSSLGAKAAPALMAVSDASKNIVKIAQLLEERKMAFSMCMNKADLLLVCGMTLLYHSMDLKQDSKTMKDIERLVGSVLKMTGHPVEAQEAPGFYDFRRVAITLVSLGKEVFSASQTSLEQPMAAPTLHRQPVSRHNSTSLGEASIRLQQEKVRRMTMPTETSPALASLSGGDTDMESDYSVSRARASFDHPQDVQRLAVSQSQILGRAISTHVKQQQQQQLRLAQRQTKLDFLDMTQPSSPVQSRRRLSSQHQQTPQSSYEAAQKVAAPPSVTPADWEALLASMDGGQLNVYDAIYGGPNIGLPASTATTVASATSQSGDGWSPESWDLDGFSLGDATGPTGHGKGGRHAMPAQALSVLSFSDESISSAAGEEKATNDMASLGLGCLDASGMSFRALDNGRDPAADAFGADGQMDVHMENKYA